MDLALALLATLVLAHVAVLVWIAAGVVATPARAASAHAAPPSGWPDVDIVVPARDEAAALPATLASLQDVEYPGVLTIYVVDDRSADGTAAVVRAAAASDRRVRLVQVRSASRRWAPKVHAVAQGLRAGSGAIVLTTDSDCRVPRGWVRAMVAPFADPAVVLVLGTVTTRGPGEARSFRERFEAIDWLSLMFASRSMVRAGRAFASSANDQAYRRSAFERAGGFGIAGRAPSGDEDLLAQRLTRLPGARAVFLDHPEAAVLTAPMPSWRALLLQRRRWVSRYHHVDQYHPAFWLGIALLGLQSVALAVALLALPWVPQAAPVVLGLWATKLAVEIGGAHIGLVRIGRRDLTGWPLLGWALLHPFYIAIAVLASFVRPSSWHAGQAGYRRRLWASRGRRTWRRVRRRVQGLTGG